MPVRPGALGRLTPLHPRAVRPTMVRRRTRENFPRSLHVQPEQQRRSATRRPEGRLECGPGCADPRVVERDDARIVRTPDAAPLRSQPLAGSLADVIHFQLNARDRCLGPAGGLFFQAAAAILFSSVWMCASMISGPRTFP